VAQGEDLASGLGLLAPKTKHRERIPRIAGILHVSPEMQKVKSILLLYSPQLILQVTSYSAQLLNPNFSWFYEAENPIKSM
jgi:hypothetical protein